MLTPLVTKTCDQKTLRGTSACNTSLLQLFACWPSAGQYLGLFCRHTLLARLPCASMAPLSTDLIARVTAVTVETILKGWQKVLIFTLGKPSAVLCLRLSKELIVAPPRNLITVAASTFAQKAPRKLPTLCEEHIFSVVVLSCRWAGLFQRAHPQVSACTVCTLPPHSATARPVFQRIERSSCTVCLNFVPKKAVLWSCALLSASLCLQTQTPGPDNAPLPPTAAVYLHLWQSGGRRQHSRQASATLLLRLASICAISGEILLFHSLAGSLGREYNMISVRTLQADRISHGIQQNHVIGSCEGPPAGLEPFWSPGCAAAVSRVRTNLVLRV